MAKSIPSMAREREIGGSANDTPLAELVSDLDARRGRLHASKGPGPVLEELSTVVPRTPVPVLQAVQTPGSVLGEELRLLRAKVWNLIQERGLKSIAMISAGPGEGKSTLSFGLAATLAQEPNRRVLLIEADLRKPTLETYLGLPRVSGLSEWLGGQSSSISVRRVGPRGFFLLSAGCVPLEQPELLGSERMKQVLQAAREAFEVIVLDCPPLVPVADSVLLQDLVDGFLCVVRARHTPRDVLVRALGNVKPERVLGLVLNDHREILSSYRNNVYRQYGLKQTI